MRVYVNVNSYSIIIPTILEVMIYSAFDRALSHAKKHFAESRTVHVFWTFGYFRLWFGYIRRRRPMTPAACARDGP